MSMASKSLGIYKAFFCGKDPELSESTGDTLPQSCTSLAPRCLTCKQFIIVVIVIIIIIYHHHPIRALSSLSSSSSFIIIIRSAHCPPCPNGNGTAH
jgi:hypothetical protein